MIKQIFSISNTFLPAAGRSNLCNRFIISVIRDFWTFFRNLFHRADANLLKYHPVRLNLLLALTKFFLKVIKFMKKVRCFSRISEISLDKFGKIWSMKRRRKGRVKGEKVNGS